MPRLGTPTNLRAARNEVRQKASEGAVVLQLGAGTTRLHERILNVDLFPFPGTDLVADCHELPIRDQSVDLVLSTALLEHVKSPEKVLAEAFRVLQPGGRIIGEVPFMQPFHGSPEDYSRWTRDGLAELHRRAGFIDVQVDTEAGPTSALLWILQEYLAMTLSFGITKLYSLLWWLLLPVLSPLKLLDLLLAHHPMAHRLASTFIVRATKPRDPNTVDLWRHQKVEKT
jgi:SAM-dependent methyltransferase